MDDFWTKISQVLKDSISQFVPLCYVRSSIPKYIHSLLRLKKKHWYSKNKLMYRKYAQQYDDAVKSYYSSMEQDIAYSKNVSKFYAYANSKINSLE